MQPDCTSTLNNMNLCKASLFDKDIKGNRSSDSDSIAPCFVLNVFGFMEKGSGCSKEVIIIHKYIYFKLAIYIGVH